MSSPDKSNYEVDPITGFRQLPLNHPESKMVKRWDGQWVRKASDDIRNPQEFVRSKGNNPEIGPQSSEPDDVFITTAVTVDDL